MSQVREYQMRYGRFIIRRGDIVKLKTVGPFAVKKGRGEWRFLALVTDGNRQWAEVVPKSAVTPVRSVSRESIIHKAQTKNGDPAFSVPEVKLGSGLARKGTGRR